MTPRFGVSHGAGGAFYDVTPFHRCRDGRAMSGDGEDRFTPIRSRGGKTGGNYLQRVLRAANRFGLRERGGLSELLSKVVYGFVMRRRDPGVLHSRI